MKSKTLEKILRRFERLPLHFIDTNVIMESLKETKLGNQCASYLGRVGYNYRGVLTISVIGEFFMLSFRDIEEFEKRDLGFRFIDKFVKRNKVRFSTLKYESFEIVDKIKEMDSRIEDTDAIHLANCIQDRGNVFVTFDQKLVGNLALEKEFGVRIIHPERL